MITILTLNTHNYGNRLQNYALTLALRKMTGDTVETVRVDQSGGLKNALRYPLSRTKTWMRSLRDDGAKRALKFIEFTHRYVPTVYLTPAKILARPGTFVVGSDQCWNPDWGLGMRADGLQCLIGVPSDRKLSYAASFGVSLEHFDDQARKRYGEWLRTFDHLSVREDEAVRIVKEVSGKDAQWVLDPTMLLDEYEWASVEQKPTGFDCEDEAYVVTYLLGNEALSSLIDARAASRGLPVVSITEESPECGPAEFIWLLRHAAEVLTDSFHCTVFSLLFHKPFLVLKREDHLADMSSRFESLKRFPGFAERLRLQDEVDLNEIPSMDWSSFETELERLRAESSRWLKSALEDCR